MASYAADIQIGVKGKAQLNQLEKQLTRVNTAVKQLNKALVLKTRAQTIKLNTKGAMNAVRDLENRINRLGRTITVNLRVNEKEGQKAKGGSSIGIATGGNNAQVAALLARSTKKQIDNQQDLSRIEKERLDTNQELLRQKELINQKIEERRALEKKLNTVANSDNERARTANRNRLFGGEVSKAGNSLSAKQSENIARGRVQSLDRELQKLGATYQKTDKQFEQLSAETAKWSGAERRRVMNAADSWDRYEKKVAAATRRREKLKNIRAAAGVGLGAAATQIPGLGGVATGALGGAAVGGPAGAVVGGLVGGLTDATRALIGFSVESGKFFNKLQLSRKALANTVETTEEYKQAIAGIKGIAQDFGGGIDNITSSYTKLNAAARSSGFTVEEVTETYRGLAAANTALGGNSERLQGILLATQQVFSKGKVQAEELRGQIGERLAGAFAKFAKSAGLSTSQLDKALEKGEVSLKDFQRFSRSLLEEYEEDAKKLYQEPENAAQRLDDAMKDLKTAMGPIVQDLMVMFINLANTIVTQLTRALNAINNARLQGQQQIVNARRADVQDRASSVKEAREQLKPNSKDGRVVIPNFTAQTGLDAAMRSYTEADRAYTEASAKLNRMREQMGDIKPSGSGIDDPLDTNKDSPKPKSRSGGGSKSVRESELPALQRELALKSQLDAIDQKMIAANKVKDTDLAIRLEGEKQLAEIAKSRLDILAEEIPLDEKKTKLAINELEAKSAIRATDEELRQAAQGRQDSIDASIRGFENEVVLLGERNEAARELLQIEQDIVELQKQAGTKFTEQQIEAYRQAAQGAAAAREQQRQYNDTLNQVQGPVSNLVGGLKEVVAGTKSAQEAFADFLNTIADQLIQTAAVMIAQYIAIGIAKAFAGLGGNSSQVNTSQINSSLNPAAFTNGPWSGFVPKAQGGYVTSPTPALVGEGGEPEYVIPQSKMDSAMSRWGAGQSGGQILADGGEMSGVGGTAGADQPPQININGGVTQINNEEFIRMDQLPSIIAQSAQAGEAKTLRRLRMSPGTRRQTGI